MTWPHEKRTHYHSARVDKRSNETKCKRTVDTDQLRDNREPVTCKDCPVILAQEDRVFEQTVDSVLNPLSLMRITIEED